MQTSRFSTSQAFSRSQQQEQVPYFVHKHDNCLYAQQQSQDIKKQGNIIPLLNHLPQLKASTVCLKFQLQALFTGYASSLWNKWIHFTFSTSSRWWVQLWHSNKKRLHCQHAQCSGIAVGWEEWKVIYKANFTALRELYLWSLYCISVRNVVFNS